MWIDEYFFYSGCIWIFSFLLFIKVFKYLFGIYYKNTDVFIYLRCGKSYTIAVIHGFPHISNELLQFRMIFGHGG